MSAFSARQPSTDHQREELVVCSNSGTQLNVSVIILSSPSPTDAVCACIETHHLTEEVIESITRMLSFAEGSRRGGFLFITMFLKGGDKYLCTCL